MTEAAPNPFLRYRTRLDAYRQAMARGWSDDRFVQTVEELDRHVAAVDGKGFVVTPFTAQEALHAEIDLGAALMVKDETGNVSGSHKARHLFGTMLHRVVSGEAGGELAIASCGNAALAAAVVARAEHQPLRVFIPTWADPAVVARLETLGAELNVSERRAGEAGDPAFLRFAEAVAAGAEPFSVQGPSTPTTLDGGRTIGWEIADQLAGAGVDGTVRVFVQVGGGALAACLFAGLEEGLGDSPANIVPVFHTVQSDSCSPLRRAWERLAGEVGAAGPDSEVAARMAAKPKLIDQALAAAAAEPESFMWPWEEVGMSAASGILDDVTYDWLPALEPVMRSGGWPVMVAEAAIVEANETARAITSIPVDATGTAGLAGLWDPAVRAAIAEDETIVVAFTGHIR